MNIKELTYELEDIFYERFPESYINIRWYTNIYNSIGIGIYLAKDKSELSGGYWENDMLDIKFTLDMDGKEIPKDANWESPVPKELTISCDHKSYHITPPDRYLAFGTRKLSFRKSQNIIKAFEKFIDQLYNNIVDDINNEQIHKSYVELVKSKI